MGVFLWGGRGRGGEGSWGGDSFGLLKFGVEKGSEIALNMFLMCFGDVYYQSEIVFMV